MGKGLSGPSASCDIGITWFGHYEGFLQSLQFFLGAWAPRVLVCNTFTAICLLVSDL